MKKIEIFDFLNFKTLVTNVELNFTFYLGKFSLNKLHCISLIIFHLISNACMSRIETRAHNMSVFEEICVRYKGDKSMFSISNSFETLKLTILLQEMQVFYFSLTFYNNCVNKQNIFFLNFTI